AFRALSNARSYSLVCVVSLGIGMGPVMAVLYGMRVFSVPPPGIKTDGLVEIITTRQGPRAASDAWSYPDYQDLRHADTGIAMTGWHRTTSDVTLSAGAPAIAVPTIYV